MRIPAARLKKYGWCALPFIALETQKALSSHLAGPGSEGSLVLETVILRYRVSARRVMTKINAHQIDHNYCSSQIDSGYVQPASAGVADQRGGFSPARPAVGACTASAGVADQRLRLAHVPPVLDQYKIDRVIVS